MRLASVLIAITRPVSPSLADCALTHLARTAIDVDRAIRQHAAYEQVLRELGATVIRAPAAPELPDAVFIEDTALVFDELAVITRPGAPSRQPETEPVAAVLADFRPLRRLISPATLDGGDVLRLGRRVYVGASSRTNRAGIDQLANLLQPAGYDVLPVGVSGCLHLKTAVTQVAPQRLLLNPAWVNPADFADCDWLAVDEREPAAANALVVGGSVIFPSHFPATAGRLARWGLGVTGVDCDEIAKAEGGVTCCSLLLQAPDVR